MSTTLKINDELVSMAEYQVWPSRLGLRLEGISTLTLTRKGGPTVKPADSLLGKSVQLLWDSTPIFAGDIVDLDHQYTSLGWQILYQCRDLRNRADRFPFTDENTLTDSAVFNLPSDDPLYLASRAGKNVGEIVRACLTMTQNAAALDSAGIGGYTSLDPPTLPAQTLADLAGLTTILPSSAQVSGGKLFSSIQSYLSSAAPNHALRIQADGVIRVLDMRNVTEHTLTLGVDPLEPTPLKRSIADCYQRVLVRGQPIAEPQLLSISNGMLEPDWAWGTYADSAAAAAAWTPEDFYKDQDARSEGTCTLTDTETVVLTSNPTTDVWPEDAWDQSNRMGSLLLSSTTIPGVDSNVFKRIVSNTAKTSGGTSTFTLESAVPSTSYDHYKLYGVSSGASLVYRRYKIVDEDVFKALARKFSFPFAWTLAAGGAGNVTSFPVASVLWDELGVGGPPYREQQIPFSLDTETGHIIFAIPTYIQAANHVPADVRFFAAVNIGELTAVAPSSGYEGTSHTIEGRSDTLTLTSRDWIDPINQSRMEAFAQDRLDSVKNTMVEGAIVHEGMYEPALQFGAGISITGNGYLTGWEGLSLPVVEVEILFNNQSAFAHTTTMQLSNRRASLTSGDFLRPSRNPGGVPVGFSSSGKDGNQDDYTVEGYDKRAAEAAKTPEERSREAEAKRKQDAAPKTDAEMRREAKKRNDEEARRRGIA